jgi:hypothetical protein
VTPTPERTINFDSVEDRLLERFGLKIKERKRNSLRSLTRECA